MTGTGPQLALLGVGMLGLLYGFLRFPLGTPEHGRPLRLRLDAATVLAGATTFGLWRSRCRPVELGWGWAVQLIFALLLQPGLFLVAVFLVLKVVLSDRSPFTRTAGPLIAPPRWSAGILQSLPPAAYLSERHGPWIMAGNMVGQHPARRRPAGPGAPGPHRDRRAGAAPAVQRAARTTRWPRPGRWPSCPDRQRARLAHLGGRRRGVVTTSLVVGRQLTAFRHIAELLRERDALTAKLTELAYHDGLTGLPNRALFMTRLADALAAGPVTVFLIDLDEFKPVNDAHGHAAGDQLLVEVADRLRALVRAGETPSRLGGDEFAVLIEGSAGDRLPELVDALRGTVRIGPAEVLLRASVGVAEGDGGSPDVLLHQADMAMYAMKQRRLLPCQSAI